MTKCKIRNLKFLKQYLKFLSKHFAENGKEKSPQITLIFKQLEKYQNEYYSDNLYLINVFSHTSLQLPHFCTKRV